MTQPTDTPKICIKAYMVKLPYICGVCGRQNPEEAGFDGFLNGKVFLEGTDQPVCEECCKQHAPYLCSLCKLEEEIGESWGYNDTPDGVLERIQEVAEGHQKNAGALLKEYGQAKPHIFERLVEDVNLGKSEEKEPS